MTAVGTGSVTVGTQVIAVTAATRIDSDGRTVALTAIKIGDRVEVSGGSSGEPVTASTVRP